MKKCKKPTLLVFNEGDFGIRLDKAASNRLPEFSRADVQKAIKNGHITVQGTIQKVLPSYKITEPLTLEITLVPKERQSLVAQAIDFSIVFEDEHLAVINKPAFLTVHPGAGITDNTLVNGLIHRFGIENLASNAGEDRPGILHRLDKDTSGLLIICKTNEAYDILKEELAQRHIHRIYNAIVWGTPSPREGTVDAMIGRNPKNRLKMQTVEQDGREAVTHYRVLLPLGLRFSLVECELETGRTHQIRVHLDTIGHPVVGDPLYVLREHARMRPVTGNILDTIQAFPRQALHAVRLAFIHPVTGLEMAFESPLPDDMQHLMAVLQQS